MMFGTVAVLAGIAGVLTFFFWHKAKAGVAKIPNCVLWSLSVALLAFLIYNMAAGGNPPKKPKKEEDSNLPTLNADVSVPEAN